MNKNKYSTPLLMLATILAVCFPRCSLPLMGS